MAKKNPVLQKKFEEGYQVGLEMGEMKGIQKAVDFFKQKFDGLDQVEGIGEKTMEKIVEQLGHEYFKKVEQ